MDTIQAFLCRRNSQRTGRYLDWWQGRLPVRNIFEQNLKRRGITKSVNG
jgi:hypothetical protein